MKCDDVRNRLPDLALGDLDAEPARAVEEHLKGCAGCRAERETLSRAAEALRAAAPVAPSTERREAAVAAMARAQAEQAEALLTRPRRRWLPWTAAAAFVLAVLAVVVQPSPPVYTVAGGSADHFRAATGEWTPLRPGDVVRPGDRLRGEARLTLEGGSIALERETEVALLPDGRLSLDQGRVRVDMRDGARRPVVIGDAGNNFVSILRGTLEAELKPARAGVGGSEQTKDGTVRLPAPRMESALRLAVRVDEGEADLGGSRHQRLVLKAGQHGRFTVDGQPSAGRDPR